MHLQILNDLLIFLKYFMCCLSIFLLSAYVTSFMRRYALCKSILDIPNERSSHKNPTPRGGGLAIVVTFSLAIIVLWWANYIDTKFSLVILGGGLMTALVGYWDDLFSVRPKWRVLIHFCAASWAMFFLQGMPEIYLGTTKVALHGLGYLLGIITIMWSINIYNFMDGIDGLAGGQGIFVAGVGAIFLWSIGLPHLAFPLGLLMAAIAGFTVWNWSPAKIFLGDIGSGYLGYVFTVYIIYISNTEKISLSLWLILFAVFICDATFTLISRIYNKKSWYTAHREHAYQALTDLDFSHKQVTTSVLLLNCILLLPAALISNKYSRYSLCILLGTIVCCWILWFAIKTLRNNLVIGQIK